MSDEPLNVVSRDGQSVRSVLVHCGWASTCRIEIGCDDDHRCGCVDRLVMAFVVSSKYRFAYSRHNRNIYVSGMSDGELEQFVNRVVKIIRKGGISVERTVVLDGAFKRIEGRYVARNKKVRDLFGRDTSDVGLDMLGLMGYSYDRFELGALAVECWAAAPAHETPKYLVGPAVCGGVATMDLTARVPMCYRTDVEMFRKLILGAYLPDVHIAHASVLFWGGIRPVDAQRAVVVSELADRPIQDIVKITKGAIGGDNSKRSSKTIGM